MTLFIGNLKVAGITLSSVSLRAFSISCRKAWFTWGISSFSEHSLLFVKFYEAIREKKLLLALFQ